MLSFVLGATVTSESSPLVNAKDSEAGIQSADDTRIGILSFMMSRYRNSGNKWDLLNPHLVQDSHEHGSESLSASYPSIHLIITEIVFLQNMREETRFDEGKRMSRTQYFR